ncbi:MAG: hypothetical protein G01um101433_556 [Parcubacteria group bacterium Gr01-1014_33]|nr:MAG: hypothetical protein G01um101433_556 [Parcubacteria group bacterium Gr01-1014_33]
MPSPDLWRIEKVIDGMRENPFMGDLHKLGGSEAEWRRRVGSYRIIFELSVAEQRNRDSKNLTFHLQIH